MHLNRINAPDSFGNTLTRVILPPHTGQVNASRSLFISTTERMHNAERLAIAEMCGIKPFRCGLGARKRVILTHGDDTRERTNLLLAHLVDVSVKSQHVQLAFLVLAKARDVLRLLEKGAVFSDPAVAVPQPPNRA